YWLELVATVLDLPLDVPEKGEFGAALGAARLAIVGATGVHPEVIMTPPKIAKTIYPRVDLRADYDAAYDRYRKAYPVLKALP
ncbi:MAG: xylulokinase, partial [Marinovum sp.]|nr:xylulokinase [Marinovum sp.]